MNPDRFLPLLQAGDLPEPMAALLADGCAIVRNALPAALVDQLNNEVEERFALTPFSEGPFHGARTRRFHRLLARAPSAAALAVHAGVFPSVRRLLRQWCDFPELNLTQGVEIHPGAPPQIPHRDQGMWPVSLPDMELCVNVFWPLTAFTAENGATRVWPGSHLKPRDPAEKLPDPLICEMQPGDALLILGSTVHAAGTNTTLAPRRALIFSYCLSWLKAYENQSLAYPREVARNFDAELAALTGYRWHRPNLGTYDGQCPSILLEAKETPDHLATIDALAPEHEAVVAAFERAHSEATDTSMRQ